MAEILCSTTWTNLLIKNDPATVSKIVELHSGVVEELKGKSPSGDFWTMALFQPMPHFIAGKGFERGGNVMGLDQVEEDALLFIAGVHVKEEEMSEVGNAVCQEWHRQIEEFARKEKSHLDWLYLNYADKDQDPFKTVGKENAEKIGKAAVKYDPGGVFQTRCPGGFKISKSEARPALS